MRLNQPTLFAGPHEMPVVDPNYALAVNRIRNVTTFIAGKSVKLAESEDRLNAGFIDPGWALAMRDAGQLLIDHGEKELLDAGWLAKVTSLRAVLDKIAKRWKIAGESLPFHLPFLSRRSKRKKKTAWC